MEQKNNISNNKLELPVYINEVKNAASIYRTLPGKIIAYIAATINYLLDYWYIILNL